MQLQPPIGESTPITYLGLPISRFEECPEGFEPKTRKFGSVVIHKPEIPTDPDAYNKHPEKTYLIMNYPDIATGSPDTKVSTIYSQIKGIGYLATDGYYVYAGRKAYPSDLAWILDRGFYNSVPIPTINVDVGSIPNRAHKKGLVSDVSFQMDSDKQRTAIVWIDNDEHYPFTFDESRLKVYEQLAEALIKHDPNSFNPMSLSDIRETLAQIAFVFAFANYYRCEDYELGVITDDGQIAYNDLWAMQNSYTAKDLGVAYQE